MCWTSLRAVIFCMNNRTPSSRAHAAWSCHKTILYSNAAVVFVVYSCQGFQACWKPKVFSSIIQKTPLRSALISGVWDKRNLFQEHLTEFKNIMFIQKNEENDVRREEQASTRSRPHVIAGIERAWSTLGNDNQQCLDRWPLYIARYTFLRTHVVMISSTLSSLDFSLNMLPDLGTSLTLFFSLYPTGYVAIYFGIILLFRL